MSRPFKSGDSHKNYGMEETGARARWGSGRCPKESHCFVLGSEADGQHRRGAANKRAGRIYLGTVESGKSREHSNRNTLFVTITSW